MVECAIICSVPSKDFEPSARLLVEGRCKLVSCFPYCIFYKIRKTACRYDSADNLLEDDIYLKLQLKYKFHHNQIKYCKALVLSLKLKSQMVYILNSYYTSCV